MSERWVMDILEDCRRALMECDRDSDYDLIERIDAMLAAARAQQPAPQPLTDEQIDAARYRWLRANWFSMGASYPQNTVKFHIGGSRWSEQPESNLDEAIDAAIERAHGIKEQP